MKQIALFAVSVAVAFALGAGAMWAYNESQLSESLHAAPTDRFLDGMFNDDFFKQSRDPFQEMEGMRKRMDEALGNDAFTDDFDNWFAGNFAEVKAGGVEQGEDDKSVWYKIDLGDQTVSDLKVDIVGGYVSIHASLAEKTDHSVSRLEFTQHFPVPPNVEPQTMKIDQESDAVIIRFDKVV